MNVGSRIREVRENRHISMKDLSEKLDCNYKYLGAIETGVENPSLEMLMKISNLLDEDIDYFVMDNPHVRPAYRIEKIIGAKLSRCQPETLATVDNLLDNLLLMQEALETSREIIYNFRVMFALTGK